mmetsp:Transcript_88010/g.251127  ORF Transcript_88010/g.251127 Transcript_88010/m.251127 type:complete len:318 (-) Transcript_88010:253-1206(-)|eukprot:CAMPEP_0119543984 /NCGR_PEP_ID=MMETSP1344-20130328/54462_1 /TAXON_ID=236787 /ORGANISM="Florenciella parvula, Strain CCMP2471" /LENGTH=317 /DNA_ID=CAMNT_0007588417 /DNA_START=219 /DNA_END=1172 /DNA_ORIENTATION=+
MKFSYLCNFSWLILCALAVLASTLYANHDYEALSQLDDIAGPAAWTRTILDADDDTNVGTKNKAFENIGLWTTNTIHKQSGGSATDDDTAAINKDTKTAGKVDAYTRGDVRVYLNRGTTLAMAALSAVATLLFLVTIVTKTRCRTVEAVVEVLYILFGLFGLFGVWWWWRSSYLNYERVEKAYYEGLDISVQNDFCARECRFGLLGSCLSVYIGVWMLVVSSGHFMCRLAEEYEEAAAEDTTSPVVTSVNDDVDVEVGETRKQAQRRLSEPLVNTPQSNEPVVDKGPTGNGYSHWTNKRERNALDRNHQEAHEHHRN